MAFFDDEVPDLPPAKTDIPGRFLPLPASQQAPSSWFEKVRSILSDVHTFGRAVDTTTANIENKTVLATGTTTRRTLGARFAGLGFDVRDFGATGDGTTNDYAAVAAALAAAGAAAALTGAARVHVPLGTYVNSSASPWLVPSNVTVEGEGAGSVLKRGAASTYFGILCNSDYATNTVGNTGVSLRNLAFDANGANQSPAYQEHKHAVAFIGVTDGEVVGCRFRGLSGDGVYVSSNYDGTSNANRCKHVRVTGCHFDGASEGRNGVCVVDGEDILIAGNTFKDCASSLMPGGIDLEPNLASQVVRNVTISGNTFDNCKTGVIAYNNVAATCENLVVAGNTIQGGRASSPAIRVTRFHTTSVTGNVVKDAATLGVFVELSDGVTVAGNVVNGAGDAAFSLNTVRWFSVSGNSVVRSNGHGITMDDCYSGSVVGNAVRGWGQTLANACAIRGVSECYYLNVAHNSIDGESRSGILGIRMEGSATNWTLGPNRTIGVGTPYALVNEYTALDSLLEKGHRGTFTDAPTTGAWKAGTYVFNIAPAVGLPIGWVCVTAGTPGTWRALANLA